MGDAAGAARPASLTTPTGSAPGAPLTPLGFAGQYTDVESGLIAMGARYYDPLTGQFLTRDPLTALTRQPYLYAHSDPVNFKDPSGLDDFEGASGSGGGATIVGFEGSSDGSGGAAFADSARHRSGLPFFVGLGFGGFVVAQNGGAPLPVCFTGLPGPGPYRPSDDFESAELLHFLPVAAESYLHGSSVSGWHPLAHGRDAPAP